jgi:hypothetical protein
MPSTLWGILLKSIKRTMSKEKTFLQMYGHTAVKPSPFVRAEPIKSTNDNILCGVELEIENLSAGHGYYVDQAGDFWIVDEDGSLRPRGESWEFISRAPATIGASLGEMRELFRKLNITEDNYSDRCSVHIHTNIQDYTPSQLYGLALVYAVFEDVLFEFVNHFHKKEEQGYCRDSNLYCIPWSACRMNRRLIERIVAAPVDGIRQWQKYTALNLLPMLDKGTVEWRHMHGTCDMEKLTIWFNIIGSIMKYVKQTGYDEIVKTVKVLNDVSTYQQFFTSVLGDTLPYTEDYRKLMAEGVVNAKYSLVNVENPKKDKRPIRTLMQDGFAEVVRDDFAFIDEAFRREEAVRDAAFRLRREEVQLRALAEGAPNINWAQQALADEQQIRQQVPGALRVARDPAGRVVNPFPPPRRR